MKTTFRTIEMALGISLPKTYAAVFQRVASQFSDWPAGYESFGERLITDPVRLVELNRNFRANPANFVRLPAAFAKRWPEHLFVFAGSRETSFWCFDVREKNPALQWINEKQLESAPFTDLRDLVDSIGEQYRAIHRAVKKAAAAALRRREIVQRKTRGKTNRELPKLDAEDLIQEGKKLARSTVQLTPHRSGKRIGIWSAEQDQSQEGLHTWLTVDLRHHPDAKIRQEGILEVRIDGFELEANAVFYRKPLRKVCKGEVSLYGRSAQEVPCLELLFEKGSRRLRNWLDEMAQQGWKNRNWPQDPSFPVPAARDGYHNHWRSTHPFTNPEIYVQLGGWPLGWPEESAREQLRRHLVLRTYRCSEPWVEVFKTARGYKVDLRIS